MSRTITHIVKRTGAVVPFNPERITNAIYRAAVAVGGRDRETAEGLTRQVVDILEEATPRHRHPTVEETQDIVEKVLIENGHARVAKAYILYREERARQRREKAGRGYRESGNIPWRKIYEVLLALKIESLLSKSEMGLRLVAFHVDNYFFDLELHPRDEFGDYDFETPQALDLALINEHLQRLIAGEEVRMPYYDFKTGKRHLEVTPMRIGPGDILLIDSLHGLYPAMTEDLPPETKFRLYIETLLQTRGPDGRMIRWTDLRLMRRMVRDASFRAYDPQRTLEHWHYVRTSEMRNIIPYANNTDYIVNGAVPYELPVMRRRLLDSFARWAVEYRDDPLRTDALERAERVHELLAAVHPIDAGDEEAIPPTSHLREFIGGSAYDYSG